MPRRFGLVDGKKTLLTSTNHIILGSDAPVSTKGTTFILVSAFPFNQGEGEIFNLKVITQVEAGVTGEVRVYDVTNAQVIASTTFTNTTIAVTDLGAATNLPVGDAIFELQLRRSAGLNKFAFCEGLLLEYPQ